MKPNGKPMRDRPPRQPKQPRLEWPGGVVPEWAKAPMAAKRRKAAKGGGKRERLQKVMAQSGYGSRRNIEILIAQGHLTINGQLAKLGDQVGPGDKVKLDGKLIRLRFGEPLPRVLIYHKPTGEIVTRDDPEGRPTVFEKLPKVNAGRWLSIGRLDFNTEGLLLFTTNGELVEKMSHPRFEVEREYAVRVMGELTEETREKLLKTGVDIDGEMATFDSIEDRGGEGSNHWYHVVLREGRNREVRRMFEAVGLMVSRLMRVRFGNVTLPGHIKRGQMREMDEDQVHELMAFAGMNELAADDDDEESVDDEFENIGNRVDPRERPALEQDDEIDDNVGNRWHPSQVRAEEHEPDGNRGTYVPGGGDAPPRHPKAQGGKGHGQRRPHGPGPHGQAAPHGQPGQKKFFKKRGAQGQPRGEGANGNVAPHVPHYAQGAADGQGNGPGPGPKQGFRHGKRRKNRGGGQPGQGQPQGGAQPHAQAQGGQPQGAGNGPGHGPAQPGQGKPGRHRRKNRNRGGGQGGPRGADGRGEPQPANDGNRENF